MTACSKKAPVAGGVLPPVSVKFEVVETHAIEDTLETVGELKADKEVTIAAERQGQISNILVREGQWVQAGETLIRIKGNDAVAELKQVEADYEAFKKLEQEGAISKQDLRQHETALRKAQAVLDNLQIKSVSSGTVGRIYVDPGDYLKLGDPIMDLVKLYPLRVSYNLPESMIPRLKIGQKVDILVDSYPGQHFFAYIDFIAPRIDPSSRSILLRARLADNQAQLKANQFVKVRQLVDSIDDALMVREEAIYLDQGQQFLYLADLVENHESDETHVLSSSSADNFEAKDAISSAEEAYIAKRVEVKTGIRQDGLVQIIEGIEAGDRVIYAGLHSIYPGAKLAPQFD